MGKTATLQNYAEIPPISPKEDISDEAIYPYKRVNEILRRARNIDNKAERETVLEEAAVELLSIAGPGFIRLPLIYSDPYIDSSYALGIALLQKVAERTKNLDTVHIFTKPDGSKVYRPLTFREYLLAIVEDYNTLYDLRTGASRTKEERLGLFCPWGNSCTGIVYKPRSTRFKLKSPSPELITLPVGFNKAFLPIEDYETVLGIELDSTEGTYNRPLTRIQVLEQPAWLAAAGWDRDLLKEISDIVFVELSQRRHQPKENVRAMGSYVGENLAESQLRDLCFNNLDGGFGVDGYSSLLNTASFTLLTRESPQPLAKK